MVRVNKLSCLDIHESSGEHLSRPEPLVMMMTIMMMMIMMLIMMMVMMVMMMMVMTFDNEYDS